MIRPTENKADALLPGENPREIRKRWHRSLALTTLPLGIAIALTILFFVSGIIHNALPRYLVPVLNTCVIFGIDAWSAWFMVATFRKTGSLSSLLFGMGILLFGSAWALSGWFSLVSIDSNSAVHFPIAVVASAIILAGSLLTGKGYVKQERRRSELVVIALTAELLLAALITLLTYLGMMPAFYTISGSTPLRNLLLSAVVIFFGTTSVLMLIYFHRSKNIFVLWVGMGLVSIALSYILSAFIMTFGSWLPWASRFTQYAAAIYFLVAGMIMRDEAHAGRRPTADLLADFGKRARLNYEQLVEAASDAIIAVDESGRILMWNPAAEKMFNYSRSEAIDLSISDLLNHPEDIDSYQKSSETGHLKRQPLTIELRGRTKEGKEFPMDLTLASKQAANGWFRTNSTTTSDDENAVTTSILIIRDVTERKKADEEIQGLSRLYAVISQVNQSVVHSKTQEEFLETVCRIITEYGGFQLALIGKIDGNSTRIVPVSYAGISRDYADGLSVSIDDRPEGRGPIGTCIRESRTVVQNDFINDPNTRFWHERARNYGFHGAAAFPIMMDGRAWGALAVYSDKVSYFGERETRLLEEAAGDIGFALGNFKKEKLRLWAEENLNKAAKELQLLNDSLSESEERFRLLAENSKDVIFRYRLSPEPGYDYVSPSITKLTGYSPEECYADPTLLFKLIYPDDRENIESETLNPEKIPTTRFVIRWVRKDSQVLWVEQVNSLILDNGGTPVAIQGECHDITGRVNAEKSLKESEAKFRNLADQSPNIIFIHSGKKIVYANSKAAQITGYAIEELCSPGFNFLDLSAPEYREKLASAFRKHMMGQETPSIEYDVVSKNGSRINVILNTNLIEYSGQRAILGTITDISERKEAEIKQQRLREKAEISSRLAAVGEMAAGIAHEINNPLTAVIGFSELLMEEDLPQQIKDQLKIIGDGGKRVKEIVRRLLTFARQTEAMKSCANINELIKATLDLRSYVLRTANIEVVEHLDPALPCVLADPGQLQQVFLNVIVNAEYSMKKAHDKGTLTITTQQKDDQVFISFKDDGLGISQENLEKIFNPFFTTKEVNEGTGLGLSLSHSIILEHGGTIEVESEPGKGATFIIKLPITGATQDISTGEVDVERIPRGETRAARILVVDDEEAIRRLLSTVLAKSGHIVESTADAREALVKMDTVSYDVVLMDIRMPGMSGIELYNDIKPRRPELAGRFIFITGDTSDENTQMFLVQNDLSYLTKPFETKMVVQKVNDILQGY